jgi:hypothetical protein
MIFTFWTSKGKPRLFINASRLRSADEKIELMHRCIDELEHNELGQLGMVFGPVKFSTK